MPAIEMKDKIYGKLTVIEREENNSSGSARWLCKCECGNSIVVLGASLRNGHTKSCGCFHKETASKQGKLNKKYNEYNLSGDYGMGITSTNEKFFFDLEDYDKIKNYCWYISKQGYVCNRTNRDAILLHRLIMEPQEELEVDHINHNKIDNRKENLRNCSSSENNMNKDLQTNNTSGHAGVYWHKQNEKWCSEIRVKNKKIYLGSFPTIEEAIESREKAEIKYFKEFRYERE